MIGEWIAANEALLGWLMLGSVVSLIATPFVVLLVLIALPAGYFARNHRPPAPMARRHPLIRLPLLVAKNALGVLFVLGGLAMLVLRGQGILTLLVGLILLDFPGKYLAERWLVQRPWVLPRLNRIRARFDKPPFAL